MTQKGNGPAGDGAAEGAWTFTQYTEHSVDHQPRQDRFDCIPQELRDCRQWVVWRFEHANNQARLTKVPYNPTTRKHASSTDASTWLDFSTCRDAARAGAWDGIGFVLSEHDPYVFIDLDHADLTNLTDRQGEIGKAFNSYSEVSPSGHGLHIIVRGVLPGPGHKRHGVEMYDRGRYMTMTGKLFTDAPIATNQLAVDWLYAELAGMTDVAAGEVDMSRVATADDWTVHQIASRADNGEKFSRLWNGDLSDYRNDHSATDMALVELLAFYTSSAEQIERLWMRSPLGNRDKTQNRKDYRQRTILAGLARVESRRLPSVDTGPIQRQLQAMLSSPSSAPQSSQVASVGGFSNLESLGQFTGNAPPPRYVWHRVLQAGSLYALTAPWGAGKTAIAITVAMHVATGRALAGRKTEKSRVLFLCGENPDDVKLRVRAAAAQFGIESSELEGSIYFTKGAFSIDDQQSHERFVADARRYGSFDLMIVDTGPAHSKADDENDNRQMQLLAEATRYLMSQLGNPATVALMHPTKNATRDNLQPRGGGAFSGSIDGELCAWKDGVLVEFFHRTKFRGPGFDPMFFTLERHTFYEIVDNFGEPAVSVVAMPTSAKPTRNKVLTGANRIALDALKACGNEGTPPSEAILKEQPAFPPRVVVPEALWRDRCYDTGIAEGEQDAKRRAFARSRKALMEMGLVRTFADSYWLNEWCEPRATSDALV